MRFVTSLTLIAAIALAAASACGGNGRLIKQYEYEEEIYFDLDGSARVIVNASLPALVALRGIDVNIDPRARLDRARIRREYESPVTRVMRVSRPWRRDGRRFVQIRIEVDDIRRLSEARPFTWSRYELGQDGESRSYRQAVGPAAGKPVGGVGWDGDELVAFRVHVPSKIEYHNAPSRKVERGNILVWEQTLADRLAGRPLQLEARMQSQSILWSTLILFASTAVAALAAMAAVVWWTMRQGAKG